MRTDLTACLLAAAIALTFGCPSPHAFAGTDAERHSTDHPEQSDIAGIKRLRDQKAWYAALDRIESLAARFPGDDDLYVLRVHTLSEIGARQQAWRLYRARPALFSPDEAQRIELDRLAALVGSSHYYDETPEAQRRAALSADAAVADYLARSGLSADTLPPRLRNDRILLLNLLGRHGEVVALYDRMRAAGLPVPGYVAAAVGDSLLALRRPERAIEALEIATAADPGNAQWAVQRAYALSEAERFAPALAALDALAAGNAPWLRTSAAAQPYPNWRRYDAEVNRALIASYGEDLPGAQAALEGMLRIAPENAGLHASLGSLYARRGWPARGLQQQRIALTLDPRDVSARIGEVEGLFALQRSDLATPKLAALVRDAAEAPAVQRLRDETDDALGWHWRIDSAVSDGRGTAGNSPRGSRDARHAFEIEGPLVDDRWRIVGGATDAAAEFGGRSVHDRRAWAGVDYAHDRLGWRLVASRSVDALDSTGAALDLRWRFADTLQGALFARRHDPDASLQARAAGIQADSAGASLAWQRDERTGVSASAQRSRYDDGNRRDAFSLRYDHRLFTAPHLLLDGSLAGYASRGTRDDAPYFNPARDRSFEYTLRADHVVRRRYERHLRQRLSVTVGDYRQDGFGDAWTGAVQYEHAWRFAPARTLTYGARWSRPVYDGHRETHVGLFAGFAWGE